MLIAGDKTFGLAKSLNLLYPTAMFASRKTSYNLTTPDGQKKFAEESLNHDVVILCSSLHSFNQTILLNHVYKQCTDNKHRPHIITIGSTTDRVTNGKVWLYNAEKKALRDYSNSIGLTGVWGEGPKITLISYGSLSNVQHKYPGRKCLDIDRVAAYIKWVIEQPKDLVINEISIDPMQDNYWLKQN